MWLAWGVIGFILVIITRYMKHLWKLNVWAHIICGILITVINVIYGFGAIYRLGWRVNLTIHGILGTILTCL